MTLAKLEKLAAKLPGLRPPQKMRGPQTHRTPDGVAWAPVPGGWVVVLEDPATGGILLEMIGGSDCRHSTTGWEVNGRAGFSLGEAAARFLLDA